MRQIRKLLGCSLKIFKNEGEAMDGVNKRCLWYPKAEIYA